MARVTFLQIGYVQQGIESRGKRGGETDVRAGAGVDAQKAVLRGKDKSPAVDGAIERVERPIIGVVVCHRKRQVNRWFCV
jgi:hypothetical protein